MNSRIEEFKQKIQLYERPDQEKILAALEWAQSLHQDQKRASGEPYFIHPLGVASILVDLKLDADTISAALLHDVLEDTATTGEAIEQKFNKDVRKLVEGVTKIADIHAKNKTLQEAENIRKMLFAMVQDIRVILIKLADKLHNMRTLDYLPPERRKANAQDCLDIYAPLADRLGISWIKDELEDLSLKHLNRDVYDQIKGIVALKKKDRESFLNRVQEAILTETQKLGIEVVVNARAKHFYSIYQKMRKRNKGPEELFDLFGIRILCNTVDDCYTLVGTVHHLWKPIEGRFKDYIAMPKSNGYQSLHTTVMSFDGKLLEIQIRTKEMHQIAEYGVASHWLYKKGTTSEIIKPEDLSIVNRLKDWNSLDMSTFLDDIKQELLKDSIFVFTPQGKVIELPAGSTPIDFAYHIHSAIGDHCAGAKADGSIIPLTAELKNTQVVEILTTQNAHPHVNWLRAVKTAKARSKIRTWLQQNDETLIIDKNIVARKKSSPTSIPSQSTHQTQPIQTGQSATQKFEGAIQTVIQNQNISRNILQVKVEDERNMMIRFAQCCKPVTGDPIIGYVSRGRGIIIHRNTCKNLHFIPDFEERKIEVEWEKVNSQLVKRFKIEARKANDLFSAIEGAIRKHQGHLLEGRIEETSHDHFTGFFTLQLEHREDLKQVIKSLKNVPSVLHIQVIS
ncbi:RelA/SpoT family protein [Gracilinema caldarium]|uniref:(P)ppGpp synthetase I, SpoT/RelA n=1 Tax=Gracilinema caldarium (strain ATCC 51460 / DSM 7334 / H1) TaxID=744872 RepID=F8EYK6_GRAC1|nr:bifunctional (p)ppGpp synthetase/guanosine-3',5'-bis(diphosphate) 3'-pyrophosphohydrolase [Gracilinema caldarium]AEJ18583.1 (p)ppGpp synthetase I, SpoT/RelA [Gracilinema caldarium DSM 7334]